jgi:ribonuclease R
MLAVRRLRGGGPARGATPSGGRPGRGAGRPGDWWELNEEATILRGSRAGATVRLGDAIAVRVRSIEAARGRVDLDPA